MTTLDINHGKVFWITGFSGAGKTTVAKLLVAELSKNGLPVAFLDGDELREILRVNQVSNFEYNRDERISLSRSYSSLALLLANQGLTVVVATISLFKEVHRWNRENIQNYFEVFLDVPLEVRKARDPKGIYNRYTIGLERNVAGLDLDADVPNSPNCKLGYVEGMSAKDQMDEIISEAKKVGLV